MSNLSEFVIQNGVLKKYKGLGGDVIIPDGVTSIGNQAFFDCRKLTSVTIPDGVTSIGNQAFFDCRKLAIVTIPESVTSIGHEAFSGCRSMTSVTIPDGVTEISSKAFYNCSRLASIKLPTSLRRLFDRAFSGCSALTDVTIQEGLERIDKKVFFRCTKLARITIPDGIKIIDDSAFEKTAFYLEEENWENDVLYLGRYLIKARSTLSGEYWIRPDTKSISSCAFSGCSSLTRVMIPEGVTEIGSKAFYDCISLESIKLPTSLRCLFDRAFSGCSALTDVTIPESVERIDQMAFSHCTNLTSITMPDGVRNINCSVFVETAFYLNKENWENDVLYLGRHLITARITLSGEYQIRPNTKSISSYAFCDCRSLTSITIPESVTDIGREAFAGCKELRNVIVCGQKEQEMLENALLCAALDEKEMEHLIARIKKSGRYAQENFYETYMVSDTRAAMLLAEKRLELNQFAAMRGIDVDELRDKYLSDVGLNDLGSKVYDLGSQTVTARLQKDLSFLFELPNGKIAKSLPKKNADPEKYAAANADFDEMRKMVKKIVKSRGDSLFRDFLSGRGRKAEDWQETYLKKPLLRGLAELVVWEQSGKRFILADDKPIDSVEQPYTITDALIKVAHPMEMDATEVKAWQQYFIRHDLKQPFLQIWEPVIDSKTIRADRYEGSVQPMYRFAGKDKHGIHSGNLQAYSDDIGFKLDGCELDYEASTQRIHYNGANGETYRLDKFSFKEYTRQVNHIVALLDGWTVEDRIRKDDVSVSDHFDTVTLAQIMGFIQLAQEANAVNVLALLLNFKNTHFSGFDPMDEFTLEE